MNGDWALYLLLSFSMSSGFDLKISKTPKVICTMERPKLSAIWKVWHENPHTNICYAVENGCRRALEDADKGIQAKQVTCESYTYTHEPAPKPEKRWRMKDDERVGN